MVRSEKAISSAGYNVHLEAEAQAWIEEVMEEPFTRDFGDELRDGRRLCRLMNLIKPGSIRRISDSSVPFKQMENISNFIKTCRALGVPEYSLFETVDLFELKDLGIVVTCLHALGGAAQLNCPEFPGPHLGLKPGKTRSQRASAARSWTKPLGTHALRSSQPVSVRESDEKAQDLPKPPVSEISTDKTPRGPIGSSLKSNAPPPNTPPPPFNDSAANVLPPPSSNHTSAPPPPPPFDESAVSWKSSADVQRASPPAYQEIPAAAMPSDAGLPATAPPTAEDIEVRLSESSLTTGPNPSSSVSEFGARGAGSRGPPIDTKAHAFVPESSVAASAASTQSVSPSRSEAASLSPHSAASSATPRPAPVTVARGGGYGLDAELAQRREANYDYHAEQEAQEWIEAVTGELFADEFGEELRSGRRLCILMNAIKPGVVRRVNESRMPFKQMENISNFLKACRSVGVAEHSLFETVDLFEGKDLGLVVRCLHALGQTVQTTCPEFDGPHLGIRHTESNKRDWSAEQQQQQARRSAGAISKVMAGSSKTMERGTVIKEGVTFGATSAGTGDRTAVARWTMGSQSTMERLTVSKSGPTFGAEYAGTGDPNHASMVTRGYR